MAKGSPAQKQSAVQAKAGQGDAKRRRGSPPAGAGVSPPAGAGVPPPAGAGVPPPAHLVESMSPDGMPPAGAGDAMPVDGTPPAGAGGLPPAGAGVSRPAGAGVPPSGRPGEARPKPAVPLAGADASSRPMLVCEAAAEVLRKASKGVQRIPLERLGVSPFNRRINGRHVHQLGRRILSVEGFVRMRYQWGWCHEPNPADELAVSRYTNAAARGSGLLAPVPDTPLFGSFAKTHLLSFLQALKTRQVRWDKGGDLMLPDEAQEELMEHLAHGMFYEVLSWQVCERHPDALKSLIASDNFDAGFSLGQTEMHLLQNMRNCIVVARPPVGQTLLDVVRGQIMLSSGQQWSDDDVYAFYSAAKVLGEEHLRLLSEIVDTHVNVNVVAVQPADFLAVSRLPASVPWLKVALLATQYMSPEGRLKAGPRGRFFGAALDRAVWDRLKRATATQLEVAETFLRSVLDRYALERMTGLSNEAWMRDIPALFVRVASQVALAKDLDMLSANFHKAESKLRESWAAKGVALPAPITHGGSCGSTDSTHGGSCGAAVTGRAKPPTPEGPALTFVEGQLVPLDLPAQAQSKGFLPGVPVLCVVKHQGVPIDTVGTVDRITADRVIVRWALAPGEKSCLPCDDLDHLRVQAAPAARAAASAEEAKRVASERAEALESLPRGRPWTASLTRDTEDGVAAMLTGLLWQLHQAHVRSPEHLVWSENPRSPAATCTAKEDFKAGRLVFIPWPSKVVAQRPAHLSEGQFVLRVELLFGKERSSMFLVGPRLRQQDETADTPSGRVQVVFPFWDILNADPAGTRALSLQRELVDLPLHAFSASKALLVRKPANKQMLRASIPFWTNAVDVKIGDRLSADATALSSEDDAAETS